MKLVDLKPRWFDVPGVGGDKDGVTFLCPCARCQEAIAAGKEPDGRGVPVRLAVQFANPIGVDPKPLMTLDQKTLHVHELRTFDVPPGFLWTRVGEDFETMSVTPSVDASASGHWHGFLTNGVIS